MHPALIALLCALGLMTLVWLLSLVRRDASVIDVFWGPGFALIAWLYFDLEGSGTLRSLIVPGLVTLWGVRLGAYIFWRGRGRGEDYRYHEMREKWGRSFPWVSLFLVFHLQAVILWAVSIPLLLAVRSPVPEGLIWLDFAGLLLFATGFLFESVGDFQLARFKADPANRGKVLDRGLWRYTRHPNYFGDALVWWGLFLLALATPGSVWTVYSPALMTFLLMKVSGVALLEKGLAATKPRYRGYVERTSGFFPWPPRRGGGRSPEAGPEADQSGSNGR